MFKKIIMYAVAFSVLGVATANAQSVFPCYTDSVQARTLKDYMGKVSSAPGSGGTKMRNILQIPYLYYWDVPTVVTDTVICTAAAKAHARMLTGTDTIGVTPVLVIKVGSTRYVISDKKSVVKGKGLVGFIYDQFWNYLTGFAG